MKKIITFRFCASVLRKLSIAARLELTPATAGVALMRRYRSRESPLSVRMTAPDIVGPSRRKRCNAAISMYADVPMYSSTSCRDVDGAYGSRILRAAPPAGLRPPRRRSTSASLADSTRPSRGSGIDACDVSTTRCRRERLVEAGDDLLARAMTGSQASRHHADGLDGQHSRQMRQLVQRPRRSRLDERDGIVLPLRDIELHVEQHFDGVEREHADDQHGDRKRHAQGREPRPHGLPLQVAQDHLHRRRSQPARNEAVEPADDMSGWWFRPHGFGRWKPHERASRRQSRPARPPTD